ncbi:MAG: glycosyl hydrolase family 95 catalytic domain-containing protein, partial [Phocaeicola sp.]
QGRLKSNQMEFTIRIHALNKGGELYVEKGKIYVKDADEVIFFLTADTDYVPNFNPDFSNPTTYVGIDPKISTKEMMQQAISYGYEAVYKRHIEDYSALFNRVTLNINNTNNENDNSTAKLPTYKRLELYREGKSDYQLEELYYQFGRYLLIASSRPGNLPANLQGMWHNGVDGPWHVDYHNNINLQMNYWPACMTNLDECVLPLIDFIRTLVEPGKKTAKAYFNARGWTASISGNIFGFTAPLTDKDMSWNFNPMAGPWLATHIWEYYDYTRDEKFLKDTGYQLIKDCANFTVDYLWKLPNGSYTAAPSTSPEHGPIDRGATFVHAVAREILLNAIEASKVLNTDKEERAVWKEVLNKLVPYKIGNYGQLMEWSRDIDDPKDKHRHVNHLFGLHPGKTISPITTPDLAMASYIVLKHRGDGATGWSMGWKLNQWARLQDGNHAYKLYGNLLKNGTLDNLLDTHPPFQIDGNFGGTAGVTEMLLQSHMGFIQLLPALPDVWKEGSVNGLRARGNFEISMEWSDNKLTTATIISNAGGLCTIRYGEQVTHFHTVKGKKYLAVFKEGVLKVKK